MAIQANTEHFEGEDLRKYTVGQRLRFLGLSPDEAAFPVHFEPGDIIEPVAHNGCGMGIDCVRLSDGKVDMVWPEEVEVLDDESPSPSAPGPATPGTPSAERRHDRPAPGAGGDLLVSRSTRIVA